MDALRETPWHMHNRDTRNHVSSVHLVFDTIIKTHINSVAAATEVKRPMRAARWRGKSCSTSTHAINKQVSRNSRVSMVRCFVLTISNTMDYQMYDRCVRSCLRYPYMLTRVQNVPQMIRVTEDACRDHCARLHLSQQVRQSAQHISPRDGSCHRSKS